MFKLHAPMKTITYINLTLLINLTIARGKYFTHHIYLTKILILAFLHPTFHLVGTYVSF